MIIATAQSAAEAVVKSAPVSIEIRPGRKIINMPKKPDKMAPHL